MTTKHVVTIIKAAIGATKPRNTVTILRELRPAATTDFSRRREIAAEPARSTVASTSGSRSSLVVS